MIVKGKRKCFHCDSEYISYNKKRKYCGRKCWANYCILNLKEWTKRDNIIYRNKELWFRKKVSDGLKNYYQKQKLLFLTKNNAPVDFRIKTFRGIRNIILARDNYCCCRCSKGDMRLDIHHIIPRRAGGKNETKNLITLCRKCHQFIEKNQYGIYQIVKNWEITRILTLDSLCLQIT